MHILFIIFSVVFHKEMKTLILFLTIYGTILCDFNLSILETNCIFESIPINNHSSQWIGDVHENCKLNSTGIENNLFPLLNSQIALFRFKNISFEEERTILNTVKIHYEFNVDAYGYRVNVISMNSSLTFYNNRKYSRIGDHKLEVLIVGNTNLDVYFQYDDGLKNIGYFDIESSVIIGYAYTNTKVKITNFWVEFNTSLSEILPIETLFTVPNVTTHVTTHETTYETTTIKETTPSDPITSNPVNTDTVNTDSVNTEPENTETQSGTIITLAVRGSVLLGLFIIGLGTFLLLTKKKNQEFDEKEVKTISDIHGSKMYHGRYVLIETSHIDCDYEKFQQLLVSGNNNWVPLVQTTKRFKPVKRRKKNNTISRFVSETKTITLVDKIVIMNDGYGTLNDYLDTDAFDMHTKYNMVIQLASGIKYLLSLPSPLLHTNLTAETIKITNNSFTSEYGLKICGYEYITSDNSLSDYKPYDNYNYLPYETLTIGYYNSQSLMWMLCVCIWAIINMKKPWASSDKQKLTKVFKSGSKLYFNETLCNEECISLFGKMLDVDYSNRPKIENVVVTLSSLLL